MEKKDQLSKVYKILDQVLGTLLDYVLPEAGSLMEKEEFNNTLDFETHKLKMKELAELTLSDKDKQNIVEIISEIAFSKFTLQVRFKNERNGGHNCYSEFGISDDDEEQYCPSLTQTLNYMDGLIYKIIGEKEYGHWDDVYSCMTEHFETDFQYFIHPTIKYLSKTIHDILKPCIICNKLTHTQEPVVLNSAATTQSCATTQNVCIDCTIKCRSRCTWQHLTLVRLCQGCSKLRCNTCFHECDYIKHTCSGCNHVCYKK